MPSERAGDKVAPPDPWDPLVRISHWAVAFGVLANGVLDDPGGTVHVWIGWAILALLALRFVWGFVGPAEARFSAFPPDPRAALSHLVQLGLGRPREHRSHNPAGAMMVYALWALLVVVTATGLIMTGGKSPLVMAEERAAVAAGDWSVLAGSAGGQDGPVGEAAEEVHEIAANLILILAAIHVAGVVLESRVLGRDLLRPMLRGPGRGR